MLYNGVFHCRFKYVGRVPHIFLNRYLKVIALRGENGNTTFANNCPCLAINKNANFA